MSETLTGGAISTVFKKLVFTKATSGNAGDIFYTQDSDGVTDTALTTFTSALTFTGRSVFNDGLQIGNNKSIYDVNNNEAINILDTSNAVNSLSVENSATGDTVAIKTAGEDNDVDLTLTPKGTGGVISTPLLTATLGVKLANNIIYNSEGTAALTLDADEDLTITGDLKVSGGIVEGPTDGDLSIKSDGIIGLYLDSDNDETSQAIKVYNNAGPSSVAELDESGNLQIDGDLTLGGNDIKASDGTTAITTSGANVTLAGTLTVAENFTIADNKDIRFNNSNGMDISDGSTNYISFVSGGMTFSSGKTLTLAGATTISGAVSFTGNAANTPGTGITGGATCKTYVERFGDMIKTTIYLDLAGLRHTASGDILGVNGTSNPCHIGQITAAKNGTIVCGQVTCMEVPDASNVDIDLYTSTSATEVEDTAISGIAGSTISINGGSQTLGKVTPFVDEAGLPDANDYLYLTCVSASGDADYSVGKLLFEFWGTA